MTMTNIQGVPYKIIQVLVLLLLRCFSYLITLYYTEWIRFISRSSI